MASIWSSSQGCWLSAGSQPRSAAASVTSSIQTCTCIKRCVCECENTCLCVCDCRESKENQQQMTLYVEAERSENNRLCWSHSYKIYTSHLYCGSKHVCSKTSLSPPSFQSDNKNNHFLKTILNLYIHF